MPTNVPSGPLASPAPSSSPSRTCSTTASLTPESWTSGRNMVAKDEDAASVASPLVRTASRSRPRAARQADPRIEDPGTLRQPRGRPGRRRRRRDGSRRASERVSHSTLPGVTSPGRRRGTGIDLRLHRAALLGEVSVATSSISAWCDRPDRTTGDARPGRRQYDLLQRRQASTVSSGSRTPINSVARAPARQRGAGSRSRAGSPPQRRRPQQPRSRARSPPRSPPPSARSARSRVVVAVSSADRTTCTAALRSPTAGPQPDNHAVKAPIAVRKSANLAQPLWLRLASVVPSADAAVSPASWTDTPCLTVLGRCCGPRRGGRSRPWSGDVRRPQHARRLPLASRRLLRGAPPSSCGRRGRRRLSPWRPAFAGCALPACFEGKDSRPRLLLELLLGGSFDVSRLERNGRLLQLALGVTQCPPARAQVPVGVDDLVGSRSTTASCT